MDFYPVKKLLKERRERDSIYTFNEKIPHKSRSQASSPTDGSFAKYEAHANPISPLRYSDNGQRRFDLAYTLSVCNKQQERRSNNEIKSPSKLDRFPKKTATTFSGISLTTPAVTPSNRRYVVHLSSPKDQDFHRVPLYQNNIYHIRDKNEKKLQQILNSKEEYQRDYNKIAAKNNFAKFRSGSPVVKKNKHRRHNSTMAESTRNGQISEGEDEIVNTNNSMHEVAEKWEIESHPLQISTYQGEIFNQSATISAGMTNNFQPRSENGATKLLDGLEEIYHQDLSRNEPPKQSVRASLDIKKRNRSFKGRKGESHTLNLQNFKHIYNDERLMEKLKDPYAKKLPFEKPVNGNIRHSKTRELGAIETKAEVLRNIKFIEESMRKEVNNSLKLPQIRDKSKDSAKGEEETFDEAQVKQLKQSTISVPSPMRGRSPRSRTNHILAYYVGRNKL